MKIDNQPDDNLPNNQPNDTPFDAAAPPPAATAPYDPNANETRPTPTKKGGFPIKAVAIGAVALLLIGGLFFQYRRGQAAKEAQKPDPAKAAAANIQVVSVVPVTTRDVLKTITVTGSLRALQNIDLSSKASGRVARVAVQEGEQVQRGQLLVALEDNDLQSQVEGAQAALRTSQVRLQQQQVGLPARIADINTTIEKARTTLASSQTRLAQAKSQEPSSVQAGAGAIG